jgi:hypothetical protein
MQRLDLVAAVPIAIGALAGATSVRALSIHFINSLGNLIDLIHSPLRYP